MSNRNSFIESTKETDERLEALKQLYPEIFSDGKINLDAFKDVTGTSDLPEGQDRTPGYYGLYWPGKRAAKQLARKEAEGTLEPVPGDGVNEDTTHNIYIEGDNLEVLRILKQSYKGRVKMIYIDPPYNTGNDFIYPDDFKMPVEEYLKITGQADEGGKKLVTNLKSNGAFHTTWLNMMYPRLQLARELLTDDGFLFLSVDYNENYNARQLLNEIFGEENFVGEIYWESKTKSQNTTTSYNKLQPKAEMIFVFSKGEMQRFNLIEKGKKEYPLTDDKGNYREYPLELMNANGVRGRETMIFDINDGVSTVSPPKGKQWKLGQDQVATYKEANDLFIRDGKVIIKMRPEYERSETTEPFWGFFPKELGTAESAKKELNSLLDNHGFETVKPVEILRRLIHHATEKDSIVMDFFSGSASTAHAMFVKNIEDFGNRKFLLVQLDEQAGERSSFKTICEIGKERIRRAGAKVLEEAKANKDMFSEDYQLDIGFKVYRLQNSNFVKYTPVEGQDEDSQNKLFEEFEKNQIPLVQGWKAENVLTEIILKQGFALDCTKEKVDSFKKNTIWKITDSADAVSKKIKLYVCLDNFIDEETIKNLTLNDDEKFICLDAAIDDSAYARLADKGRIETI